MTARVKRLKEGIPWQHQELPDEILSEQSNTVCITRYGGIGDMIQMSSILSVLKREGYKITVNTTDSGYDVLKHDPRIDAFFLQQHNQVPNCELGLYWDELAQGYDRHIQLSEVVEIGLLPAHHKEEFYLPKDERHNRFNVNYLERIHEVAGVDFEPDPRFYPTLPERKKIQQFINRIGKRKFNVIYSLSGSSVHKIWPYMDQYFAYFLHEYDDVQFVTVGSGHDAMLEVGWEKEPRVITKCGKFSVREALTLTEHGNLLVGTETGLLNAAGFSDVPKICMLSHSTEENLTKHWKNTVTMEPEDTPCYPCHRLHYSYDYCPRDEATGVSLCASNIGFDRLIKATEEVYMQWRDHHDVSGAGSAVCA